MRLSFSVSGSQVTCNLELGTLSYKRTTPYDENALLSLSTRVCAALERALRNGIRSAVDAGLPAIGRELSELLVPTEIADRLLQADRELYLHVDEKLVAVPWELLYSGDEFWCERYDIGRAVSTPQKLARRPAEIPLVGPLRMLVICSDPAGDLPHVRREGQALLARLERTTELQLRLVVNPTVEMTCNFFSEYDIVHFAGHADYEPQHPERSGWRLADGRLTAERILMHAKKRRTPLLVYANACRSNEPGSWSSDPEHDEERSVYGLANAFLLGGVRLYLGTLWKISDGEGSEFALAFYKALSRGATAGAALRVARGQLQNVDTKSLVWASYVLYGDPGVVPVRTALREDRPPIPSSSLIRARVSAPWKRPSAAYSATGRPETGPPSKTVRKLLVALLAALMLVIGFVVGRRGLGPVRQPAPQPMANAIENVAERPMLLQAALLAPPILKEGRECVEGALRVTRPVQLASAERVAQIAEPLRLSGAKRRDELRRVGQALEVDLVIGLHRTTDSKGVIRLGVEVVDPMTGELIHAAAWTMTDSLGCRHFARTLTRLLQGQGEVVAVEGPIVTINLGWNSRIAPGAKLEVVRQGNAQTLLTVEQVTMDRCVARGAARVGDRVRIHLR